MDLDILHVLPHPPTPAWPQIAEPDAGSEAAPGARSEAAWNAMSARIIALAILVLRRVNPHATARHVFSYLQHSTLRDLLDEAVILEPELTARLIRGLPYHVDDGTLLIGVRRDPRRRPRRPRMRGEAHMAVRHPRARRQGDAVARPML